MGAADGLGESRAHRQDGELGVQDGNGDRVRAHDLEDVLGGGELLERAVGEQAVRAGDADRPRLLVPQHGKELKDRRPPGDLVVEDDHVPVGHLADDRGNGHLVVAEPLLRAGGDGHSQAPGERGGGLGVAQVRRQHHGPREVTLTEVRGQLAQRVQVVDRDREEAVDLSRVQGEGQHPVDAGRDQQVGHEAAADRDARRVFLVRARVGVVRHDRGHPRSRGAARGVRHQQQLDQVLLHGRDQGLNDIYVTFPAVRLELHLQAVVGEAPGHHRAARYAQVRANLVSQLSMGVPAEDHNLGIHRFFPFSLVRKTPRCHTRPCGAPPSAGAIRSIAWKPPVPSRQPRLRQTCLGRSR